MQHISIPLLLLILLPLHFLHAQQEDPSNIYTNWQLDEKSHQLLLADLPKKLDKNLRLLQINYKKGESRLTDFYTLGEADFYLKRGNAFRINKRRYSGALIGFDEDNDIRYEIEFLNGKLDGYFIVYQTDGSVITKIFQRNQLKAKTVKTADEVEKDPPRSLRERKFLKRSK